MICAEASQEVRKSSFSRVQVDLARSMLDHQSADKRNCQSHERARQAIYRIDQEDAMPAKWNS
jgi:hypothetical protein